MGAPRAVVIDLLELGLMIAILMARSGGGMVRRSFW